MACRRPHQSREAHGLHAEPPAHRELMWLVEMLRRRPHLQGRKDVQFAAGRRNRLVEGHVLRYLASRSIEAAIARLKRTRQTIDGKAAERRAHGNRRHAGWNLYLSAEHLAELRCLEG